MALHIGYARVTLHLPESHSLKSKRQIARSLIARLRQQFNVAAAEADDQDLWQRLTLGICCLSNQAAHADAMLAQALNFIEEQRPDLDMLERSTEIISGL